MPKKRQSKRMTLHKKYKIIKKVSEHHRKQRKLEKQQLKVKKTSKKDPGIPNLYPFKEELLNKIQQHKEALEAEKERKKQEKKKAKEAGTDQLSEMQKNAAQRERDFKMKENAKEDTSMQLARSKNESRDNSLKSFYREVKKVIEASDVILQVLDARDPMGCRCFDIEKMIMERYPTKKIVLILNKIDLIPKENVSQWLKYLKNYFPTIAFKCTTAPERHKIGNNSNNNTNIQEIEKLGAECFGGETLLQLLKNYSRNRDIKTSISVGIIGYPNVGKSSLVNSLKRARAVSVANTPGHTKVAQEVNLDKSVKLIDSPGIVPIKGGIDVNTVLRNVVKVERIEDSVTPVTAIIQRCGKNQLLKLYQIPTFSNTTEFLTLIAHKRKKMKAGGIADLHGAALTILHDWTDGKIAFHTTPPKDVSFHVEAKIVDQFGEEFQIDQSNDLDRLQSNVDTSASIQSLSKGQGEIDTEIFDQIDNEMEEEDEDDDEEDEDDDEMDEEDDDEMDEESEDDEDEFNEEGDMDEEFDMSKLVAASASGKVTRLPSKKQDLRDENDQYNPQTNQQNRKQAKRDKKKLRKAADRDGDNYSFQLDFYDGEEEEEQNEDGGEDETPIDQDDDQDDIGEDEVYF